jgi:c-di-GMP-binding flagellar brake protein YcgR
MGPTFSPEAFDDRYLVRQPNEVLRILKQIVKERTWVNLRLTGDKTTLSVLLDVDVTSGHFLYSLGRDRDNIQAILNCSRIRFDAKLRGAPVSFSTASSAMAMFEGSPALRSPLPQDMHYVQRREYHRTTLPGTYTCCARLEDGSAVSLGMEDISLGGVGLHSTSVLPERLPLGSLLPDAVLDFREMGKLELTLKVVSHKKVDHPDHKGYLFGCRFVHLPMSKETIVQRLVFSFEQFNRAQASNLHRVR